MKKSLILLTLSTFLTVRAGIVIYPSSVSPTNNSCGHASGCPGGYCTYVNYTKTVPQGWGWVPDTNSNIITATNTNSTHTKIEIGGAYGDHNCGASTVSIEAPYYSPVYRFTVYFTNNADVPRTTNYPLVVDGIIP